MRYLKRERSPWELIKLVDSDLNEFISSLKNLMDEGLVESRNGKLYLTETGKKEREKYNLKIYDIRCHNCEGRGIIEDPFGILEDYKNIALQRPKPTVDYDQGYIKEEDVMRRIAFIYERGDLENAKIIVIGDDDLISLGMALTDLPKRIVVLEIDDRLINFINENAKKYGFPVEARKFDVRNDIDKELCKKFDIFITDPVETIEGITLFLSRAASGLKGEGSVGYFGLTHLEASLKKWQKIERRLLSMNFVITDMLRDFNVYPMSNNLELAAEDYIVYRKIAKITGNNRIDADFYRSTLIRIEAVGDINPLVTGSVELREEIYVDNESLVTAMATRRKK